VSLDRFGLKHSPFLDAAGPCGYVAVPAREEPLVRIEECLNSGLGLAVLTSAPGLGKTALCRELARRTSESHRIVLLQDAGCRTRRHLLQAILYELDRPYAGLTEQESRLALLETVRKPPGKERPLVLIVDEAHALNDRLLEELRNLSNHETDGVSLVRVLLAGNLELEERLIEPGLAAINQRIACHEILDPLSQTDSAQLIDGRIMQAGGDGWEHVFSRPAMELICLVSDGSPRNLEHLAGHSLQRASVRREQLVSVESVQAALTRLKELPLQWNEPSNLEAYLKPENDMASGQPDSQFDSLDDVPADEGHSAWDDYAAARELPLETGEHGAVIEIGAGLPTDDALETLFLRSGSSGNIHDDDFGHPTLDDTAVLELGTSDEAAGDVDDPLPADVGEPEASPYSIAMHSASPAVASSQWTEQIVEDRYADLDRARQGGPPAAPAPRPPASPPPATPGQDAVPFEEEILEQVHSLSAEIRRSQSVHAPDDSGKVSLELPSVDEWQEMAEWDVIQPEWMHDQIAAPADWEDQPQADAPAMHDDERCITPEMPADSSIAASSAPPSSAPSEELEEAVRQIQSPSPSAASSIRIDPGQRRYSQLFSRLRRLRSRAGAREALR
jgi:type II secretory pathway predicted ATPase ExeA